MKALPVATRLFVLGALFGALAAGCADQPRPTQSAQNAAGSGANPGAASAKDGGGGGW